MTEDKEQYGPSCSPGYVDPTPTRVGVVEEIAAVVNAEDTRPVELEAAPLRPKTALEESVDGVRREVSMHLAEAIKELTQYKLSYEDGDEVTLKLTLSNVRGRIWNKETKEYDDREAIIMYASLTTRRAL